MGAAIHRLLFSIKTIPLHQVSVNTFQSAPVRFPCLLLALYYHQFFLLHALYMIDKTADFTTSKHRTCDHDFTGLCSVLGYTPYLQKFSQAGKYAKFPLLSFVRLLQTSFLPLKTENSSFACSGVISPA